MLTGAELLQVSRMTPAELEARAGQIDEAIRAASAVAPEPLQFTVSQNVRDELRALAKARKEGNRWAEGQALWALAGYGPAPVAEAPC